MAILSVRDLNIEFHDNSIPETVVYDFDLELNKGDIIGIVGESGSGKTMSALAIAGLLSRKDMKKRGINTLYLLTDHNSFYERYGWEFFCMVQGDGEDTMSRMYVHR